MSKYGSTFVESEAILAATATDRNEVWRIVKTMTPSEARNLEKACRIVIDAVREVAR